MEKVRKYVQFVFVLLLAGNLMLLTGCRTAPSRGTSAAAVPAPVEFLRSDVPQASSREEIQEFSKILSDPYYIGPGDVLRLKSGNNEFPEEEFRVSPDSKINVTDIGEVSTARKELKTLQEEINEKLKVYYSNVECKLSLVSALNRKISLLGAVKSPGVFPLESDMTLIDIIAKAGGFDVDSGISGTAMSKSKYLCRIIRDNGKSVWIDLREILFQNAGANNIRLKNNDILYVYRQ